MEKEQSKTNIVTLVHGTRLLWFKRSRWTLSGSRLRDFLKLQFSCIEFFPFPWSGSKSNKARIKAASELQEELRNRLTAFPDAIHFIIAHSHGGNIVLRALRDLDIQSRIKHVICLNTPFIMPMRRGIIFVLPLLVLFPLASIITFPLLRSMIDSKMGYSMDVFSMLGLFLYTFLAIGVFGGYLLLVKKLGLYRWGFEKQAHFIKELRYPEISSTVVTCLWSGGDEIYEFFQLGDLLASLPYLLLRLKGAIVVLVITFFAQMVGIIGLFPWRSRMPGIGKLIDDGALASRTGAIFDFNLIGYFYSSMLYFTGFILLVALVAIVINGIFSWLLGFGLLTKSGALHVRLAITAVPSTSGGRINFRDFDIEPGAIYHSAIYNDERVLRSIIEIIEQETNRSQK